MKLANELSLLSDEVLGELSDIVRDIHGYTDNPAVNLHGRELKVCGMYVGVALYVSAVNSESWCALDWLKRNYIEDLKELGVEIINGTYRTDLMILLLPEKMMGVRYASRKSSRASAAAVFKLFTSIEAEEERRKALAKNVDVVLRIPADEVVAALRNPDINKYALSEPRK